MRFGLDEDQQALRSAVREILAELCPPAVVRAAWERRPDPRPWQALADAGALAALAPEDSGGLGLDVTHMAPILEEAGRVALPHPLTETALVAAPLGVAGPMVATDLGTAGPALAGDPPAGSLLHEAARPEDRPPQAGDPAAEPPGRGSEPPAGAVPPIVPAATYAEVFLLVTGRGELRLFDSGDVELTPLRTVDAARHAARVRPRGRGELVTGDPEAVIAAFDRGVLGTAAELVGLSRTMLELTVGYVAQRHQFGRPVGSFQAVKHHLANARLQIEFAAPAVLGAAYAMARNGSDARRSVSQAKYLATEASRVTAGAALQCHGAVGYTTEHDLHLFLKRSWALARSWGGSGFHADRVTAEIGL